MGKIDIKGVFPIVKIKDGLILSGLGDLTFGYELMLPEIYTITEDQYHNIYESFLKVFKNLPPGTVITQQDHYRKEFYKSDKEYTSFTMAENAKLLLDRGILLHKSYLFISTPDKVLNALTASQNSGIKKPNFFSKTYDEFPKTLKTTRSIEAELDIALGSIDCLNVKKLETPELKNLVYKHWSNGENYQEGSPIPPISEDYGYIKCNGKYIGVMSMINHGEITDVCKKHSGGVVNVDPDLKMETDIDLQMGLMSKVGFDLPFDHVVQRSFVIKSKEKMKFQLRKAAMFERGFASFGWDDSIKRLKDISSFNDGSSDLNYLFCDASVNVFITEENLVKLQDKLRITKTVIRNINDSTVWEESYSDAFPLWISNTPGYSRANYRTFKTVLEHGLSYCNWETNLRGSNEGHLYADRLGCPVTLNLWKNKYIANKNGIVEGGSGTGKSVFTNTMIDQDYEMGYHVMILDVGHSYFDQCKLKKGVYKDSRNLKDLATNIFICDKNNSGDWIPNDDKLTFLHTVLMTMWQANGKVKNSTYAILYDIIDDYYKHVNKTGEFPVFNGFYNFIKEYQLKEDQEGLFDQRDFTAAIKPFAVGKYKDLLNTDEVLDLTKERFIVFDIEGVSGDKFVFPIVGLMVMEITMEKIRKLRGIKKRFLIDEGWKILQGDMADFVEYLYRTFRKNEGGIWLATQAISDLDKHVNESVKDTLINNSDTIALMRRGTKKNYEDLQHYLSLTDGEIEMMKDLKKRDEMGYREFFLKQGDHALILRNEISEKTITVFNSEGDKKKDLDRLFNKTKNIKQAVNQQLENNRKAKEMETAS